MRTAYPDLKLVLNIHQVQLPDEFCVFLSRQHLSEAICDHICCWNLLYLYSLSLNLLA